MGKITIVSLPSRGAWIEIYPCRTPYPKTESRSPPGERGLKWQRGQKNPQHSKSLPSRGAWIEIQLEKSGVNAWLVAPLPGSVD